MTLARLLWARVGAADQVGREEPFAVTGRCTQVAIASKPDRQVPVAPGAKLSGPKPPADLAQLFAKGLF